MERLLRVGVIASTHGVHGEANVYPTTDSLERFRRLKNAVLIDHKGAEIPLRVENVKFFKQFAILKFAGIDTIEQMEPYKGCDLMVNRADAEPLAENENYIGDLLEMKVVSDEGETLGILTDVLETGANDVYLVTRPDGRELLLPAIPECILDVDLEAGVVTAHVMPGLEEL